MSKVNDIKNCKRQQRVITPTQALAETVVSDEETKEETNKTINEEKKIERKHISFDLRTDLYKELKMQAIVREKNMYTLIEEALDKYLKESNE